MKTTMRISHLTFIAVAILAFTWKVQPAQADGSRVENQVGIPYLVAHNSVAMKAKVLAVRPVYAHRHAYGKNRRYVTAWRIRIKPLQVIAGNTKLKKKPVWIRLQTHLVPGKRVLIQNLYPPTLGVARSAKRGSKIVVFSAGWETWGKEDHHISNIDWWTTDIESELVRSYQALVPPSPVP